MGEDEDAAGEGMPEPPEVPADLRAMLLGAETMAHAAHLASSYFDELVKRGFGAHAALHLVCGWQDTFWRSLYESDPKEDPE